MKLMSSPENYPDKPLPKYSYTPLKYCIEFGRHERWFTLSPDTCSITRYHDDPDDVEIIIGQQDEDNDIVCQFYMEYGWHPDQCILTKNKNPHAATVELTAASTAGEEIYILDPSISNIVTYYNAPLLEHVIATMPAQSDKSKNQSIYRIFNTTLLNTLKSDDFRKVSGWQPDVEILNEVPDSILERYISMEISDIDQDFKNLLDN